MIKLFWLFLIFILNREKFTEGDDNKYMNKTVIDDGFESYLVEGAEFDGEWEIPIIKNKNVEIPKDIVPYDKIKKIKENERKSIYIHFYMHDIKFRQVITNTKKYLEKFKEYGGVISPDCSLYIDMPLCLQMANTYMNRAVGVYLQNNGIKVIPNVRWGDERSFKFAFDGLEENGVYAISTLGCIRSKEDKTRFKEGLREMIKKLNPQKILVHGTMPEYVFGEFQNQVTFINYESWISRVKRGVFDGNK